MTVGPSLLPSEPPASLTNKDVRATPPERACRNGQEEAHGVFHPILFPLLFHFGVSKVGGSPLVWGEEGRVFSRGAG